MQKLFSLLSLQFVKRMEVTFKFNFVLNDNMQKVIYAGLTLSVLMLMFPVAILYKVRIIGSIFLTYLGRDNNNCILFS